MNLKNQTLEAEARLLLRILEENYRSARKDLWRVSFHWWRYYFHLNKELDRAKTLKDRAALIEQYVVQSHELMGIEKAMLADIETDIEKKGATFKKIPEATLSFPVQDMIRMMQLERAKFSKRLRAVKREKEGLKAAPRSKGFGKKRARRLLG